VIVGYGTVWRFIAREDITFKKNVRAAEQERPDVAEARLRWMSDSLRFDPAKLVFVDETGHQPRWRVSTDAPSAVAASSVASPGDTGRR
jgi:hypothetical protein